jgi:hypothetical protein
VNAPEHGSLAILLLGSSRRARRRRVGVVDHIKQLRTGPGPPSTRGRVWFDPHSLTNRSARQDDRFVQSSSPLRVRCIAAESAACADVRPKWGDQPAGPVDTCSNPLQDSPESTKRRIDAAVTVLLRRAA